MKKMTIALFTAAAMGTGGFAVAQTDGPNVGGRIDMSIVNADGSDTNIENRSTKFWVSGSAELAAGLTGSYYLRVPNSGDYAVARLSGDFGTVQIGRDDDIVYKFAGVDTDVFRQVKPVGEAKYGDSQNAFGEPHLQYHLSVDNLSFGAYVDTAKINTGNRDDLHDGAEEGVNTTQFGLQYDYGMGTVSAVYADSKDDAAFANEEVTFGATLDLGVAKLAATYSDDTSGNNPYVLAATIPLTDILSANVAYSDNDQEVTDAAASIVANLGGGFDIRLEALNGDSTDTMAINVRQAF